MMKKALAIGGLAAMLALPAHADTVPEYALDKDYVACMGGTNAQQDPERGEYCSCIRDTMKSWSVEQYSQVAQEGAKAHSAGQEPTQLQDIAKACITKVLGSAPQ